MRWPQTLISKDFCKAGDLSPQDSGFALLLSLPSHSQQEAHFLFSFQQQKLVTQSILEVSRGSKDSKVKLPGLEA